MRPVLISACLFGSLIASAGVALAKDPVRIKYSHAELASERGASALYEKVTAAAKEVCRDPTIMSLSAQVMHERECTRAVIAKAISDVNAPVLTSYYESVQPGRNAVTRSETLASR